MWRPHLWPGESRIFYKARGDYGVETDETFVVKDGEDSAGGALAPPLHFVCRWIDRGAGGGRDGGLWHPVAPEGYTCLSDVAVHMDNDGNYQGKQRPPHEVDEKFRCVHNSLVKPTDLGSQMWIDRKSGAHVYGAVWHIEGSPGMRANVADSWDARPPAFQWRLKRFTADLFRDLDPVEIVNNPSAYALPVTIVFQRHMEITNSAEEGWNVELGSEITSEVTAGIEGIASSKLTATITSKFGTSTHFASSETSSVMRDVTLNPTIPPHHKLEVWQLIVKDSRLSHGSVRIHSKESTVTLTPLDAPAPAPPSNVTYHLAPMGSTSCGTALPVDEEACLYAGKKMWESSPEYRGYRDRIHVVKGYWHWVPPGCSVQSNGDWATHYNLDWASGGNDGLYSPVCVTYTSMFYRFQAAGANTCLPHQPVDEESCLEAARSELSRLGRVPQVYLGGFLGMEKGSWSHVPPGCCVHTGDWSVYFNTNQTGSNEDPNGFLRVCDISQ